MNRPFFLCAMILSVLGMSACQIDTETSITQESFGAVNYKYFYKGETNENIYFANSNDGLNWSSIQVSNGGTTTIGPAASVFGNLLFLFHKGKTNNNIYHTVSSSGINWPNDSLLGNNAGTIVSPSSTVFNGKIYICYTSATFSDQTPSPIYLSSSSNGITWTETSISSSTNTRPWVFTKGNSIYIVYGDSITSRLKIITSADAIVWFNYAEIDQNTEYPAIAVNPAGHALLVSSRREQSGLPAQLMVSYSDNLMTWSIASPVLGPNGTIASTSNGPSIIWDNLKSRFLVVYKGKTDNGIYLAHTGNSEGLLREQGRVSGTTTSIPYIVDLD